jgi:hypothetical protein
MRTRIRTYSGPPGTRKSGRARLVRADFLFGLIEDQPKGWFFFAMLGFLKCFFEAHGEN